jgi:hypothetical protein
MNCPKIVLGHNRECQVRILKQTKHTMGHSLSIEGIGSVKLEH